jgi:periplasmic protein CpxP/Spy
MPNLMHRAASSLAAATFVTVLAFAGPLAAAPADLRQGSLAPGAAAPLLLVQANPAAPAPAQKKSRASRADRVEAQIKRLHDQLKITPAQEQQWTAVAQAMRDNAQSMQAVIDKRRQNQGKLSAVDDLRSYQDVAQTHVQGLQRLIPAFQALYDSMSDDQKKNADAVFSKSQRRGHRSQAKQ